MGVAVSTAYLRDRINNLVLRGTAFTPPTILFAALFTGDPGDSGAPNFELQNGNYYRPAITWYLPGSSSWGIVESATPDFTSNALDVTFPVATSTWLLATFIGLCDAPFGGHVLIRGPLPYPIAPGLNQQFRITPGAIQLRIG